jgi:hypothetical protein
MEIGINDIVPVTYKGKVIGVWKCGCIEFNDTDESKEIMEMYLKGSINGVSSRKTGSVDESGKVTEDKILEFSLIDAPPITSFEDVQKREQELVDRINNTISKEILLKCYELGSKQINSNFYTTVVTGENSNKTYLTPEEIKDGKPGYILVPWVTYTPYVTISDKNGTRRIRQVSYWTMFKMWLYSIKHKIKNYGNKKTTM